MTQIDPGRSQQPVVSDKTMSLIVYILYFGAYFVGITAIVGVIIAHVQKGSSGDPILESHYDFQIRTFWIGLLYAIVGFVLMFVLIGFLVWLWAFIWSLIRNIKGILALNENRRIANPHSWLFG